MRLKLSIGNYDSISVVGWYYYYYYYSISLPKELWTHTVQAAAVICNRCYNRRVGQTPYYMLTGRKPDLSRINIFWSVCYAYKHTKKKFDAKCEKGIIVGYDKNNPTYLVFYPDLGKVSKHRLVKCITISVTECHAQTDQDMSGFVLWRGSAEAHLPVPEVPKSPPRQIKVEVCDPNTNVDKRENDDSRPYPKRERRPPQYLRDY